MAYFFKAVHGLAPNTPNLEKHMPLCDAAGNDYTSLKAASHALAQEVQLGKRVEITDGKEILEATQGEDLQTLSSSQEIRSELLTLAQKLDKDEAVLVKGWPHICAGEEVPVFCGYGRSRRGRPWMIMEAHCHEAPPLNLVEALLKAGEISEEGAEYWKKQPPHGCGKKHFRTM